MAGFARDYRPTVNANVVRNTLNRIKLVHEEIDRDTLAPALAAINQAQRACFLGFGYHPMNLARLRVLPSDRRGTLYTDTEVWGTAFRMAEGLLDWVAAAFGGISVNRHRNSAEAFVRSMKFVHESLI